jgi:GlcNAc-P-P-Und epimerase
MIRAIKKGHFIFPGSKQLRKSYAYIEGLLDSFEFVMGRTEKQIVYNYVEQETETLENLVKITRELLGRKNVPTLTAPLPLLLGAAEVMQALTGGRSPIHPMRVRKAASSTHIVPVVLKNLGFKFNYDFRLSLQNWREKAPEDFS